MSYNLSDYNYILPEDRIAQHPITPAHNSKILFCKSNNNNNNNNIILSDYYCFNLPELLEKDTLLIANNSQVFASRIPLLNVTIELKNGQITTLNKGEIFIVRFIFQEDGSIDLRQCVIRGSDKKHFRPGSRIFFENNTYGLSKSFLDDGILFELHNINVLEFCKLYGDMPLPPYITKATQEDKEKYKTSFGKELGSVATPTAGLHFTQDLRKNLEKHNIQRKEITLHVGIGTFTPVVSNDIRNHTLHSEVITIDRDIFEIIYQKKISKKKIITIGTTSTRTIESLPFLWNILSSSNKNIYCSKECQNRRDQQTYHNEKYNFLLLISDNSTTITFSSSLFIYPGFERKIIDGLVTNFHLPQTSLVMLVAGMIGYKNWKNIYHYALDHQYRFASFGDAMMITF